MNIPPKGFKRHSLESSERLNENKYSYYNDHKYRGNKDDKRRKSTDGENKVSNNPEYRDESRDQPRGTRSNSHRQSRSRSNYSGSSNSNNRRYGRESTSGSQRSRSRWSYQGQHLSDDSDGEMRGIGASVTEIYTNPPQRLILLKGLAKHINESHIRENVISNGVLPKDIRLIRRFDTGASRGYAFVEFDTTTEAITWMEKNQGVLELEKHRIIMQYSKDQRCDVKDCQIVTDWICINCGYNNFKRNNCCLKCYTSQSDSTAGCSGTDEIWATATKTIMMRDLDALTTEESVKTALGFAIPHLIKNISAVCMGKDSNSISRGLCYLGTENITNAEEIIEALKNLKSPLTIDGKLVKLSYCKYEMGNHQRPYGDGTIYKIKDLNWLSNNIARNFAKTNDEYNYLLIHYRNIFKEKILTGKPIFIDEYYKDAVTILKNYQKTTDTNIVDKKTGYKYCSDTGMYYDPNSTYYWNCQLQEWLYYDENKHTFKSVLGYSKISEYAEDRQIGKQDSKIKKINKRSKVIVPKKIAQNIDRWTKKVNKNETNLFSETANKSDCRSVILKNQITNTSASHIEPTEQLSHIEPPEELSHIEPTEELSTFHNQNLEVKTKETSILQENFDMPNKNIEHRDRAKDNYFEANIPSVSATEKTCKLEKLDWSKGQEFGNNHQRVNDTVEAKKHCNATSLDYNVLNYMVLNHQ